MRTQNQSPRFRPLCGLTVAMILIVGSGLAMAATVATSAQRPHYSTAVAFDISQPARDIARQMSTTVPEGTPENLEPFEIRPDWGPVAVDTGHSGDDALQNVGASGSAPYLKEIPAPLSTFEGLSNEDNFNLFGFRVAPPDPIGDVGPNHYVEMINLAVAAYDKAGTLLMGPVAIGDLWAGFAVEDCTDPSGDPIVLYDQLTDRWILSQFTTAFTDDTYYNCVAVSQTGDPTGAYYRYAFATGVYFPDYPKYGIWTDSLVITTREFGPNYQIGVYAVEKNKMLNGETADKVGVVSFFVNGNDPTLLPLVGDGLLPADIDGKQKPKNSATIPLVGTQDDDAFYGAAFDALNIWELEVTWRATPVASLALAAQLPVASFDSIFPCAPTSRDCLPQPGIADPTRFLDVQSYRQRPLHRLAYRNFKDYETMVTNQSVEAMPGWAGVRWYEIRRDEDGYTLYQQGTYAPDDGVHRWMGSIAQDRNGNTALGYSVVNGVDVYPGIRYTGRLADDPLGEMSLGEGVIIDGTGVQTTTSSRWGDYSSMNIDPTDDCTFWYVNEYYEVSGFPVDPAAPTTAPFQTRIGSFKLPGCEAPED